MNITISPSTLANNRKPISMVGSTLGGQYFNATAREAWPEFDKQKLAIEQGGNVELMLNRSPRRYRMMGHDVLSVCVAKDPTGADKLYINKDTEDEISMPIANGMEKFGILTDDVLARALRGDKSVVLANASKLAQKLNSFNNDEKRRLMGLRERIDKMIQQIDCTIDENNKKAELYEREMVNSAPQIDIHATACGGGEIIVEKATTED